jgi:predicted ArsR family transcriptional regulator
MQETFYIDTVEQAESLLKSQRIELLRAMEEARTCPELAEQFGRSPQQIYYHVKALEKAGLVEKVAEKRVRGTVEGHYQASARTYWLAPQLVGQVGSKRQAQDQMSLRFLLSLAEEIHEDIGRLGHQSGLGQAVPSMGLSANVYLPDGRRRAEFLQEVQESFMLIAEKYGLAEEVEPDQPGSEFRLVLACYPTIEQKSASKYPDKEN